MNLIGPRAFLSSVYAEYLPGTETKAHFRLRRLIWELGQEAGVPIWVAEYCGLGADQPWVDSLSACVEELTRSDLLIVLLARRPGAPVELTGDLGSTVSSIFEVELFFASQKKIPVVFYVVRGYEPEPELGNLIRVLDLKAHGSWFLLDEHAVAAHLRSLLSDLRSATPAVSRLSLFADRLSDERSFTTVDAEIQSTRLSFIDRFGPKNRTEFSADRFQELISRSVLAKKLTDQLGLLWMAMRELSINQFDAGRAEYWWKLARSWPSRAAWIGLHGVLNTGVLASLHTQIDLDRRCHRTLFDHPGAPYGALASEFYSTALISESTIWRRRRFAASAEAATRHAATESHDPSGALAIRASAQLRLAALGRPWLVFGALADYREVCRIRERNAAGDSAVGEALVELGFAEFQVATRIYIGRRGAVARIREGIKLMSSDLRPGRVPFLVRGRRKLAYVLRQSGKLDEAAAEQASADALAREYGLLDQLNRDRSSGMVAL